MWAGRGGVVILAVWVSLVVIALLAEFVSLCKTAGRETPEVE